MLKRLIIISGVLAAVALAFPGLVTLGLFALILPGLVLAVAPTVFLYLAASGGFRSVLPFGTGTGIVRIAIALAASVALGWLVVQPFRFFEIRKFQAAIEPEVVQSEPVPIAGLIRIERRGPGLAGRQTHLPCDELCAALLTTPDVRGVTLVAGKDLEVATRWRLVPRGSVPDNGLAPKKPEDIFNHYPSDPGSPADPRKQQAQRDPERAALAANWTLRLATRETLVAENLEPGSVAAADFKLTFIDEQSADRPGVRRVELRDRAGKLLLRRSLVTHRAIRAPLFIDFAGSPENARFAIGREHLSTGGASEEFRPVSEVLRHCAILRPTPSAAAPAELRARLVAALDTPEGNPPDLALAGPWMDTLGYRITSAEDADLFRRIIADLRIRDVGKAMRNIHSKRAPAEYRPLLVARILAPETSPGDRHIFAFLLAKMPAGTFAGMTGAEHHVVDDPALRHDAAPFVERLADAGRPGLESLLAVLRAAVAERDWRRQRPVVRGVRRGLARLGPDAAEGLPLVRELFERRSSPIMQLSQEATEWRIAMVRMGLPVSQIPYPAGWNEQQVAREQEAVRSRIARFDPDWESGYSY